MESRTQQFGQGQLQAQQVNTGARTSETWHVTSQRDIRSHSEDDIKSAAYAKNGRHRYFGSKVDFHNTDPHKAVVTLYTD